MQKKTLEKHRTASYFEKKEIAIGKNEVVERSDIKKEIAGTNKDIFEVTVFDWGIIKCNDIRRKKLNFKSISRQKKTFAIRKIANIYKIW